MSGATAEFWNEFRPAEILPMVGKRRGVVAAFFCLAVALTVAATILWPRVYRSQGKLLVRSGRENSSFDPVAQMGAETVTNAAQLREFDVNSVAELIANRELLEKVVDAVGLDSFVDVAPGPSPPPRPSSEKTWWEKHNPLQGIGPRATAVRQVAKHLIVETSPKSNVLVVSYEGSSPEQAQAVVSKLMAAYLEVHLKLNRTRGSFDFLERQSTELRGKLQRMEAELCAAKNECGMVSPAEQALKLGEQLRLVESGLLTARAEAAGCQARTERLRKWIAEMSATEVTGQTSGMEDKAVVALREQLYGLMLKEQELLATTKADYFEVPQIRQRVAQAKALLAEQPQARSETVQGPSKRSEEACAQILHWEPEGSAWEAKVQALTAQLSDLHKAVAAFHQSELRINQLQRDLELCEKDYRNCQVSFEQARLDEALAASRIASINIAQPATFDEKPVWPRPLLNLALGMFFGLFGGVGLALTAEFRSRSRSPTT